jgi:LytS/YehU family sensor histidine kinase
MVQLGPSHSSFTKGMLAIILVGAISTGFGLLNYVAAQEKIQEEKLKERLQSELSFLRTQISPHFIFNILNSIVYLIRSKSELAEPITIKLSEIIRYMLYISERVEVPLEKELGYLVSYIDLQKVRFGNDVDIRFQETGNASGQMIEPMILIPFVENAFKHGIGMVSDPIIEMDLRIEGNKLSFSVKNKITPEPASDKSEGSGIGLRNVQRRLELLYPDAHQLDIRNENGWFWIQLTLTLPEAA